MVALPRLVLASTLVVGLAGGAAHAAVTVPGGNIINQTWTAANSPYIVQGDITVPVGSTLTIEAGVEVQLAANSDAQGAGDNTTRVEVIVHGALSVHGTSASPVVFRATTQVSGGWYGIVAGTTGNVALAHTSIQHAINGLDLRSTASITTNQVTVLSPSSRGVWLRAGSPTLETFSVVGASTYGVYVDEAASPTLRSCVVRNSGSYGVFVRHTSPGRTLIIDRCTLHANGTYGVYSNATTANSATITITGSVITSASYGVARSDAASYAVTYSNVWNNTSGNFSGVTAGTGMISSNPLYVSATDLRLTSNSPSRFGANGGGDQGALPYDGAPTPGLHGVLWANTTLTAAGSPYTVAGDLTVAPNTTLTIEPGTTLEITSSADVMMSGESQTRGEITVRGRIIADGTPAMPITLTSSTVTNAGWYGLDIAGTAANSVIDEVIIRRPINGFVYRSTGVGNTISNVTVEGASSRGLWLLAGSPTLDAMSSIGASTYGIYVDEAASPTLTNCVVRNSGSYGVFVRHTSPGRTLTLRNCTLNANGTYGVYSNATTANSATITVTNSIVTSSSYGLARSDAASYAVTYSNVWNNTSGNYSGVTGGTGTISQNPQYVSATDLHLQASSVSIDSGTTGPAKDADGVSRPLDGDGLNGAQFDMGAYEFVLNPVCGNGATEPGEMCDSGSNNGTYGHCKSDCSGMGPRCGDNMTNGPEQCDDGNSVNTDACLNTCVTATCGDGVLRAGVEACDDGNTVDTDACTAACTIATCGDGSVRTGVEECDDGNASNTDGCIAGCIAATCGDGFVQQGVEGCDDGNTSDGDACSSTCVSATCGDGVVQPGVETCDDANDIETDGCRNTCTIATCGDGVVRDGVEECDDGNLAPGDGCSPGCKAERAGPDAGPGGPGSDAGTDDESQPGGCCSTGSGSGRPTGLLLGGLVLAVLRRRRR